MKTISPALLVIALVGSASFLSASPVSYQFTINTQTLSGQADNLDFQLNPGTVPGAPAVSVLISNLALIGGSYGTSDIQLTGDVEGLLPGNLTLHNTFGYNDAYQPAMLGSSITFLVTLSGAGVDNPTSPGTFFGFSIYDTAGVNALLTTSRDGTIAGFNIDSTGGVVPFTNPAALNGASAATVTPTVTATPEPSMTISLLMGLAVMALWSGHRKSAGMAPTAISTWYSKPYEKNASHR